mmetsp:Transcript_6383/g.7338  ORF Transcript_6383/g.7338 Transcript_6383/m.7338 type:complete len:171 (+) Transcript_6383:508-1020(+)
MIVAAVFLKEAVSRVDIAAIGVMLVGLVFITLHQTQGAADLPYPFIGYLFAALSACFWGVTAALIKQMSHYNLHYLTYPFYFSIGTIPFVLGASLFTDDMVHISSYTLQDVLSMLGHSVCSILAQIFMCLSYKYGLASEIAPLFNILIFINLMLEWLGLGYDFNVIDFAG